MTEDCRSIQVPDAIETQHVRVGTEAGDNPPCLDMNKMFQNTIPSVHADVRAANILLNQSAVKVMIDGY